MNEPHPAAELSRLEQLASERLDPARAGYVNHAAGDSARANEEAWQQLRLQPHVLRDVSHISTATSLLGVPAEVPLLVAPTAMHRLAHEDGELATARAAARAEVPYIVAATATTSIEDIAATAPGATRWMQAYVQRDRGVTRAMLERAVASGFTAVVLTVDSPGLPVRARNLRPPQNEGYLLPNLAPGDPEPDVLELASNYARDLNFADLADIRGWTGLPLVVKGVMQGDDAARCVDAGADAVAVSNHGGRQVPGCLPTAVALEDVVEAVGERCDVYVDGGIRSGADILKALALGATAALVGRPVWWGLAIDGEQGAFAVLRSLRADLERVMALCGVNDARAVPRDLARNLPPPR